MDGLDAATPCRPPSTGAAPDVIVHQMTALAGDIDFRNIDKALRARPTACAREGTEHLLAAARPPARVASSPSPSPAGRTRAPAARSRPRPTRSTPTRREGIRETHAAIRRLEELDDRRRRHRPALRRLLRPRDRAAPGGDQVEMVRKRQFPLIGNGAASGPSLHTDDVATGTLAALERGRPGEIYNVVRRRARPRSASGCRSSRAARRQAAAPHPGVARAARSRARPR